MLVWWCGDCSSVVQYLVPILFILCLRTNKFSVFWAEPTDIKISSTSASKKSLVVLEVEVVVVEMVKVMEVVNHN